LVRGHGYEVDPVPVATLGKFFPKHPQVVKVGLAEMVGVDRVFAIFLFEAIEASPLTEGKVEFVGVPNLKNENIVLGMPKMGQAFHQSFDFRKAVGDDDNQSPAFKFGYQFMKDRTEIRFSARIRFFQNLDQITDMGRSTSWGKDFTSLGVKGDQSDAIGLP
jgi:hypothetical protein|tara:strand:+ start:1208 stop:1693 length:486 start_codon:yes stop_codon:yes gene_type:complete